MAQATAQQQQQIEQPSLFDLGGSPLRAGGSEAIPPLESTTDISAANQNNKATDFLDKLIEQAEEEKKPIYVNLFDKHFEKQLHRLQYIKKVLFEEERNVVNDAFLLKEIANFGNGIYHHNKNRYKKYQNYPNDERHWASVDRGFFCGHSIKDYNRLSARGNHLYAGDTARCDNLHICPSCSSRVLSARADEIEQMQELAQNRGYELVMFTFTMPHGKRDMLKDLVKQLKAAYNFLNSSRRYKTILESLGNRLKNADGEKAWGKIKSIEIMYGVHGWHPHFHVVVIIDKDAAVMDYKEEIAELWLKALQSVGVAKSSRSAEDVRKHGFTITKNPDPRYIAKEMGANIGSPNNSKKLTSAKKSGNIAKEMTGQNSKNGRADGSITPFDILLKQIENLNDMKKFNKYLLLWIEYVCATFQLKKITWSPGLKGFFGIGEKSDEDIIEEENNGNVTAGLTTGLYSEIRKDGAWGRLERYIKAEQLKVYEILCACGREKEYNPGSVTFYALDAFVTKYYSHVPGEALDGREMKALLSLDGDKELSIDELIEAYEVLKRVRSYRTGKETYVLKQGYLAKRIGKNGSIIKRFSNKIGELAQAWGERVFYHCGLPKQLPTIEQLESSEELREIVYSIFDERDIYSAWYYREKFEEEEQQQEELQASGGTWPRVSLDDMKDVPF